MAGVLLLQVPCALWAAFQKDPAVDTQPVLNIPQQLVGNTSASSTEYPSTVLVPLGYGVPVVRSLLACLPVGDQSIQQCLNGSSAAEVWPCHTLHHVCGRRGLARVQSQVDRQTTGWNNGKRLRLILRLAVHDCMPHG
jgi:hypothetical protein